MRILLADDQQKVRFALQVLLSRIPDALVVGEASEAKELMDQLDLNYPDMVIMDWQLPGMTDIGSISALRSNHPNLFIIVLSGRPEMERYALEAGASDFISKIDPPERLLATLARCQDQLSNIQAKS